jgi:hypothetical protein
MNENSSQPYSPGSTLHRNLKHKVFRKVDLMNPLWRILGNFLPLSNTLSNANSEASQVVVVLLAVTVTMIVTESGVFRLPIGAPVQVRV